MIASFRAYWTSRTPGQRAAIIVPAVVAAGLLYFALVQWAGEARARLCTAVATLQGEAAQLEQHAREIEKLRSRPPQPASRTDLRTLVQTQAEAAGLAHNIVRLDAPDANHVTIALGAVSFAQWVSWISGLQAHQVRLESCRIEALSGPGLASVSATLVRGR